VNLVELFQFLPAQISVAIAIMIFLFWAVRSVRNLSGSDSTYKELVDTLREEIKTLREREKESNERVDKFAHERNDVISRMGALKSTNTSLQEKIDTLEVHVTELQETITEQQETLQAQGNHIVKLEQYSNTVLLTIKTSGSKKDLDLPPMPIYRRPRSINGDDTEILAYPKS
jgi:predicted nuclease with TOPRIM domain